jgi:membrane peptidoglycan carboxypeptidase
MEIMIKKIKHAMNKPAGPLHSLIMLLLGGAFIGFGLIIIWIATLKVPDFQAFDNRKVSNSTKIYDRTGEVLLYDIHQDTKRTAIPLDKMGDNIKHATISIEDENFYTNKGVSLKSIGRAVLAYLKVQVCRAAGGVARIAHEPDHITALQRYSFCDPLADGVQVRR